MDAVEKICCDHAHVPAVVARRVASRMSSSVAPDDLEPAAWEGLHSAAVSWRPGGAPVAQWVWHRVGFAVLDEVRRAQPLSRGQLAWAGIVDAAEATLIGRLGRFPSRAELADAAGITRGELDVLDAARVRARTLTLEGPLPGQVAAPPLLDPDRPDPALMGWLRASVAALDDRHRYAVDAVYWQGRPLAGVGADLGVSPSRVSQIVTEAVVMMRDAIFFHTRGDPGSPLRGVRARKRDAYRGAVADRHARCVVAA